MFRIQLARLGQTMEQGTIVAWLKQEGEAVEIGEVLYEVETEKTIVPVQATRRGQIVKHVTRAGATVRVGAILAVAADPGEKVSEAEIAALLRAEEEVTSSVDTPGSTASGNISDARAPDVSGDKLVAVPKARALARELGVDLRNVKGTGPDGVVVPDDVRRAACERASPNDVPREGVHAAAGPKIVRKAPLSPIGRSMLSAVEKGWQIPQFTQVALVDASTLMRRKADSANGLSFMDFFLEALVVAAQQVPEVLVSLHEGEVWYHAEVDITIATATDQGLRVPVLHNAGALSLEERGKAWRALSGKARGGKLTPANMSGGIVAISNLGSRGVDYGTPLLPPGHSLIVFLGALESRALVVNGKVQAGPSVYLSIAYDHRLIDGALASRFTSAMRAALEGASST